MLRISKFGAGGSTRTSRLHGSAAGTLAATACLIASLTAGVVRADDSKAAADIAAKKTVLIEFLPRLTPSEERILTELDKPTSFEFAETSLQQAVAFIADKHGVAILLDEKALDEAGVGSDAPVSFNVKGTSLRSALRLMLAPKELAFVVRDEVLQITTIEKASNLLNVRTYPISDLVLEYDYDSLIAAITKTIFPSTWDEVGGPASITSVDAAQSLVISQTLDAQDQIQDLLRSLRTAKTVAHKEPKSKHAAAKPPAAKPAVGSPAAKGGGMF